MAPQAEEPLTIDELAARTGMTVRNIRAHQSRGLLRPPEVHGRTGYYGPDHVARVELIKELQADGYNLELIGRLLDSAGGSSAEVLRFTRALHESFGQEEPQLTDAATIARRWNADDPALLVRAVELGLLRDLGEGRFEELSPRLVRAGEELAQLGVPPDRALDVVADLRRTATRAAATFAELFLEEIWKPFDRDGRPEDRWPEVRGALESLRPLAGEALLAVFGLAMDEVVESEFGRTLERDARKRGRR